MSATDAKPWHDAAEELADFTFPLAMRHDASGAYSRNPETGSISTYTDKRPLTRDRFINHFRAQSHRDVLGLHNLAPGTSVGRTVVIDIDDHEGTDELYANERFAVHLCETLAARSIRTLAFTWGNGGYHVWIFFEKPVPGGKLYRFGDWLASQAEPWPPFFKKPESFPNQAAVDPGKYGNWVRLFGFHPKRRTWPSVFNGEQWVTGRGAVRYVLGGS